MRSAELPTARSVGRSTQTSLVRDGSPPSSIVCWLSRGQPLSNPTAVVATEPEQEVAFSIPQIHLRGWRYVEEPRNPGVAAWTLTRNGKVVRMKGSPPVRGSLPSASGHANRLRGHRSVRQRALRATLLVGEPRRKPSSSRRRRPPRNRRFAQTVRAGHGDRVAVAQRKYATFAEFSVRESALSIAVGIAGVVEEVPPANPQGEAVG